MVTFCIYKTFSYNFVTGDTEFDTICYHNFKIFMFITTGRISVRHMHVKVDSSRPYLAGDGFKQILVVFCRDVYIIFISRSQYFSHITRNIPKASEVIVYVYKFLSQITCLSLLLGFRHRYSQTQTKAWLHFCHLIYLKPMRNKIMFAAIISLESRFL